MTFELIVYEVQALTSTGEHWCKLNVFNWEKSCWVECNSWQIWWDFLTDSLLDTFSLSLTNHLTRFCGELIITFITPEDLMEAPSLSSHFKYACSLLKAYKKKMKWLKLNYPLTDIQLLSLENYRGSFEQGRCYRSVLTSSNTWNTLLFVVLTMLLVFSFIWTHICCAHSGPLG